VATTAKACVAKQVGKACWVKRARTGPESGQFYNPRSPMFDDRRANHRSEEVGRDDYEFVKVPQVVFDLYLSFLKTGNVLWFNKAQRESLN
jgi:hypothetical protein